MTVTDYLWSRITYAQIHMGALHSGASNPGKGNTNFTVVTDALYS